MRYSGRRIMLEWWKESSSHPFQSPDDIPDLPVPESYEEWQDFFVPILIRRGAIPKKSLIKDRYYMGSCRNADKAMWNGEKFIYIRHKWGTAYPEEINHFEDDDGFDLFVPFKLIENDTDKKERTE